MKTLNNILLVSTFVASAFCSNYSSALNNEVLFTQEDRDRLIRIEVQGEERYNSLQKQIDNIRIDMKDQFGEIRSDIRVLLYTFFGGIFVLIGFVVGFVMWDRFTPLDKFLFEKVSLKPILYTFRSYIVRFMNI